MHLEDQTVFKNRSHVQGSSYSTPDFILKMTPGETDGVTQSKQTEEMQPPAGHTA
jgi:hypothetical protein